MKYTWERTSWQTMKKTISPVKGSEDAEETCVRNLLRMRSGDVAEDENKGWKRKPCTS